MFLIERIDDVVLTRSRDFVYDAAPAVYVRADCPVASRGGRAVKVSVHALHRRGDGINSVDRVRAPQDVKIHYLASRVHLEDISRPKLSPLIRTPELPIRPQSQTAQGQGLLSVADAVQHRQLSLGK